MGVYIEVQNVTVSRHYDTYMFRSYDIVRIRMIYS